MLYSVHCLQAVHCLFKAVHCLQAGEVRQLGSPWYKIVTNSGNWPLASTVLILANYGLSSAIYEYFFHFTSLCFTKKWFSA